MYSTIYYILFGTPSVIFIILSDIGIILPPPKSY